MDNAGNVQVFVTTAGEPTVALPSLKAMGFQLQRLDQASRTLQGEIPISALTEAAGLEGVETVREPDYARVNAGSVTTQGDSITRSDLARAQLGVDGSGVKVGVISDGVAGLIASQSTRDLPPDVNVSTCNVNGADPTAPAAGAEGTAMMEIVHDLAPGADLWFGYFGVGSQSGGTSLDFEAAVDCLAAHVDVVVDDIAFLNNGPYDGTSAVSMNAADVLNNPANPIRGYYNAVGNEALSHYQEPYVTSGTTVTGTTPGDSWTLHGWQGTATTTNWGQGLVCPGGAAICGNTLAVPANGTAFVALSWNDPWGASTNDYDLFLLDGATGTLYLTSADRQAGAGANPTEEFAFQNTHAMTTDFYILIGNYQGVAAARTLNLFVECASCLPFVNYQTLNFDTVTGSVPNNGDAGGGVVSLGAVAPGLLNLEPYSSRGPTADGRIKPDATAPDAVSVSGAGGFPTTFSGTSASSAHAAAAAALLLSCNPALLAASGNDAAQSRATLHDALLLKALRPPPDQTQGYGLLDVESATAPARCTPVIITSGASFKYPNSLATDHDGRVYVAALFNCQVFRLDAGGPVVVAGNGSNQQANCGTFSGEGGAATDASIQPVDIAFDSSDNMYISDQRNCRIYEVSAGILTTIAGTGAGSPNACTDMAADGATASTPIAPARITVDPNDDVLFSDVASCTIRRVHGGTITTFAGNGACTYTAGGPALTTSMRPGDLIFTAEGDLFITGTCRVLKLHAGVISTFAGKGLRGGTPYCTYVPPDQRGDGGPATDAYLGGVSGLALDPLGRVYILDGNDCIVRRVTGTTIDTFAGTSPPLGSSCYDTGDGGPAIDARISAPIGITFDPSGTAFLGGVGPYELNPIRFIKPNDSDDDGLSDWAESATGTYVDPKSTGTKPLVADTDRDGCSDGPEVNAKFATLDPNDPWDFYSVPVPALFAAPDPTADFKDNHIAASDSQSVFSYFKAGAKTGTTLYGQDLNQNGVADGVEYDRTVLGPGESGPPDGHILASDAQLAFAQFKLGYRC